MKITFRSESDYVAVFADGKPVATAHGRRKFEDGPEWRLFAMDGRLIGESNSATPTLRKLASAYCDAMAAEQLAMATETEDSARRDSRVGVKIRDGRRVFYAFTCHGLEIESRAAADVVATLDSALELDSLVPYTPFNPPRGLARLAAVAELARYRGVDL